MVTKCYDYTISIDMIMRDWNVIDIIDVAVL